VFLPNIYSVKAIRAVKLLQYVIANLNLKRFTFFETHCVAFFSDRQSILHTNEQRQWNSPILTSSGNQDLSGLDAKRGHADTRTRNVSFASWLSQ
jgi:hypothetical protein